MRRLYVIGIGAGDPDQITVQAIEALRRVEVFVVIGKSETTRELDEVRTAILEKHAPGPYRILRVPDPPRDRTPDDYRAAVQEWHERRVTRLREAFSQVEGVGGILVWGDPALYDSTIRLVDAVCERGLDFECTVIPGVSSMAALAARHGIVLHRISESVQITTGRRLRAEGLREGSTVVMLDSECSFRNVDPETFIWWGAYLGLPDETLLSGRVGVIGEHIAQLRANLRARKGWIMDIYLLQK